MRRLERWLAILGPRHVACACGTETRRDTFPEPGAHCGAARPRICPVTGHASVRRTGRTTRHRDLDELKLARALLVGNGTMAAMVSRSTSTPVPLGEYVPTADRRIVLYGKSWADFEALLAVRGERSSPRMAYLDGAVELMSPSRDHEGIKCGIGCLVEAYCLHQRILFKPYGSWLLRAEPKAAGVEPDECYLFGRDHKPKERPDLVIEVVWTSGGIDKLEAYRRLGVGEVWFWVDDVLTVYVLVSDRYEQREHSTCLPELDIGLICRLSMLETVNEAIDALHEALRRG